MIHPRPPPWKCWFCANAPWSFPCRSRSALSPFPLFHHICHKIIHIIIVQRYQDTSANTSICVTECSGVHLHCWHGCADIVEHVEDPDRFSLSLNKVTYHLTILTDHHCMLAWKKWQLCWWWNECFSHFRLYHQCHRVILRVTSSPCYWRTQSPSTWFLLAHILPGKNKNHFHLNNLVFLELEFLRNNMIVSKKLSSTVVALTS